MMTDVTAAVAAFAVAPKTTAPLNAAATVVADETSAMIAPLREKMGALAPFAPLLVAAKA